MKTTNLKIKDFSFDELHSFFNMKGLHLIAKKVPVGTQVFRCRKHNSYNDFFYFEKDISYRTDLQNIKSFGRANFLYSSKFYGSIPTEEIKDGHVISIFETSSNLRNNIDGIEFYTVGMWITQKEFDVVTIIPDTSNKQLSEINEHLIKVFNDYKSEQSFNQEQIEFHELIGKEFSKIVNNGNENEYAISSAFSEKILQNSTVAGIIYPAIQTKFKGINIVINPTNADEILHLKVVIFGTLYKFGQFSTFNNLLNAELKDGYPFKWKEMKENNTLNNEQVLQLLKENGVYGNEIIEKLFNQIKRMKNK